MQRRDQMSAPHNVEHALCVVQSRAVLSLHFRWTLRAVHYGGTVPLVPLLNQCTMYGHHSMVVQYLDPGCELVRPARRMLQEDEEREVRGKEESRGRGGAKGCRGRGGGGGGS